ncbi:hypothetical protein GWE18_10720 [Bradyrhizobium sp. CSA112]|uniref:hypothetical protein n=1 Tax=Bradyrhizobium sp. CSA112 TaxID=2699170 RepID=UPI0023B093C0|nr:hypothetical protein [Bradyrhizobium sp. CSA112]MDE5453332.1 hypothetical protein [Bradyrhizobium sp. CSA112]
MLERCGYRAALYLSALIVVLNCGFFLYSQWYLPHLSYGSAFQGLEALIILIGLWLLSRIARYAGAALYIFFAGTVVFALWSFAKPMHVGVVWAITMAVLSLAAASILIFSKPFAREFAAEREKRPPYKKYLLHAFTFVIVFAAAAATLIDIVSLVQLARGM